MVSNSVWIGFSLETAATTDAEGKCLRPVFVVVEVLHRESFTSMIVREVIEAERSISSMSSVSPCSSAMDELLTDSLHNDK